MNAIGLTQSLALIGSLALITDADGAMGMTPVDTIPIPAHADAVLEPGGYHILLIDLVEPLAEGDEIELSLDFVAAEPQTIMVPVQAMAQMDMDDMDHGDMDMDDTDDGEDEDDA